MSETPATARTSIISGDLIIALLLLALMIGAYAMTWSWPANTAFFPELLSLAGMVFLIAYLVSLVWARRAATSAQPPTADKPAHSNGEIALVAEGDEDQGNESEFHDVFTQSGWRLWASAVGWMALFFGGLHVFGLLITLPVFTLLYLRLVAKASWLVCILYVLGTAGLIYAVFELFLHLPLPQGIINFGGE